MTAATALILRLALWLLPLVLGYLAGRAWGRPRVVGGLLVGALAAGLLVKPFPLGWALVVAGLLGGVPLRARR
ncbi:hypothetical protein [Oceanithermus sp.]|uniref:hypothetical protein n=1 Tax=Oceanithermus sp. TaxID=2268145 RepID=UPI0025F96DF0|nr:hypothetical protein [Oceanithermus sp.]